jgi:hypothetical protein
MKAVPKGYSPRNCRSLVYFMMVVLALIESHPAAAQVNLQEYSDRDYGYVFQYPANWKLQQLPEGDANKDIRLLLQGAEGTSFMVVVDKIKTTLKQTDFADDAERAARVGAMMQQTIAEIYQSISAGIKALSMKVGERLDLSNQFGVKFYIATLNEMKNGKPIIVAGIHAFPFNKDYSINFTMTTFYDPTATQENERLTEVFNSFQLIGEPQPEKSAPKPPAAKEPQ